MKKENGITLIALVITVIILIILAGISIAMLTGENGLITKSKQARQNMQNATVEEQERLNGLYGEMDSQLVTGSTNNAGTPINTGSTGGTSNGGGLTQEEHDALMSLSRYMPNIYDINPTKDTTPTYLSEAEAKPGVLSYPVNTSQRWVNMPVCGYSKVAFCNYMNFSCEFCFVYVDGTQSEYYPITYNSWTQYYNIPANCSTIKIHVKGTSSAATYGRMTYSLLTADSPYNPDNI